jgi:hypothetical protein
MSFQQYGERWRVSDSAALCLPSTSDIDPVHGNCDEIDCDGLRRFGSSRLKLQSVRCGCRHFDGQEVGEKFEARSVSSTSELTVTLKAEVLYLTFK